MSYHYLHRPPILWITSLMTVGYTMAVNNNPFWSTMATIGGMYMVYISIETSQVTDNASQIVNTDNASLIRHRCARIYATNRKMIIKRSRYAQMQYINMYNATQQHLRFSPMSKIHSIYVDNGSSKCSSHKKEDFIRPMVACNYLVGGFSGGTRVSQKGTIKWTVDDDDGQRHTIMIHNSLYSPMSNTQLLSPQNWSQESKSKVRMVKNDRSITMKWVNDLSKTIPFDPNSNVAIWNSTVPTDRLRAFKAVFDMDMPLEADNQHHVTANTAYVQDGEITETEGRRQLQLTKCEFQQSKGNGNIEMHQYELLQWHCRMGHVPFKIIQDLEITGAYRNT